MLLIASIAIRYLAICWAYCAHCSLPEWLNVAIQVNLYSREVAGVSKVLGGAAGANQVLDHVSGLGLVGSIAYRLRMRPDAA